MCKIPAVKDKTPSPPSASPYTCNEYREEMILAGLQRALNNPDLQPEEREKLLEQIRLLEEKMGL